MATYPADTAAPANSGNPAQQHGSSDTDSESDVHQSFEDLTLDDASSDDQSLPHQLTFVGLTSSSDPTSLRFQQAFPSRRPPHSQAVSGSLRVSSQVFELKPRILLDYAPPQGVTASNFWPHRLPKDDPEARYTTYHFLEDSQDAPACQALLTSFNDWTVDRHAKMPPILQPAQVQQVDQLPQELFDFVLGYLSRDDLKALRLTSRTIHARTNLRFFETYVVAYQPGMFSETLGPQSNETIFNRYGRNVRRFGLTYNVDNALLSRLEWDMCIKTWWGGYLPSDMTNFDFSPSSTVEELTGMGKALEEITNLKELALSIDSGLGSGPAAANSLRSQIIGSSVELFPGTHGLPTRAVQAQQELWAYIKSQYVARGMEKELAESRLFKLDKETCSFPGQSTPFSGVDEELQTIGQRLLWGAIPTENEPENPNGILAVAPDRETIFALPSHESHGRRCATLKAQSIQTLMIDTFIISIIGSVTCRAVTALNLSSLPGRYLNDFDRLDFWEALPSLETLKILVLGEFSAVQCDTLGRVQRSEQPMTRSAELFEHLLVHQIANRECIKKLSIGWVNGGENAPGLLSRNTDLLPAPFPLHGPLSTDMMDCIVFPHVQQLTLVNCWMTPDTAKNIAQSHSNLSLKKLTLDSVSLQVFPDPGGEHMPSTTTKIHMKGAGSSNYEVEWPFREGSWPCVLDAMSPGANFSLLGKATRGYLTRGALRELELISCGYSAIKPGIRSLRILDPAYQGRAMTWYDRMTDYCQARVRTLLSARFQVLHHGRYLASIIQHLPLKEVNALVAIWGATLGWDDEDARHAVEMDGFHPGGSGRFSAVIRADDTHN